ncbi:hypothetical protein [Enterovirga sp.]|uniref:hypothetical protein n=1 Tax=Enterovirga sp. TaxID=2026350 RepID=UPI002C56CE75|nr:hypothetical protein [Enterovirga sp.]HMO30850.1 hypothetical protein [Enterovirga sp.]
MFKLASAVIGAGALAVALASPAAAFRGGGGGNGGDREPAGGAFMSSYIYPGSTGIQAYGPPRSVDFPRGYSQPYGYAPYGYAPQYQYRYYYRYR